jgi:hypothetical protein
MTCLCLLGLSAPSAQARVDESALVSHLATVESEVLQSYIGKSAANPARYYSGGQWIGEGGIECWNCYAAAGTAAAVLFDQGVGGSEYKTIAIETTNASIAQHQLPNGCFEGSPGQASPINTIFYSTLLGLNYLELRGVLDASTRSRWSASLSAAAKFLIESGQTTWYINGNINLRLTELMWLAWQVTGNPYFESQYESEWAFTRAPSQVRWPGFGLQLSVTPSKSNGADGAGYLAESAGAAPGFDPEYTMLQLDTATQMYVLSREARWLRLVNLMYNQLRPLVYITPAPRSEWDLNGIGGSRKSEDIPFSTPAMYLLVAEGVRPDLASGLMGQFTSIENTFHGAMSFTNANLYRDLAEELATPMLSEQWPKGLSAQPVKGLEAPRASRASRSPHTAGGARLGRRR